MKHKIILCFKVWYETHTALLKNENLKHDIRVHPYIPLILDGLLLVYILKYSICHLLHALVSLYYDWHNHYWVQGNVWKSTSHAQPRRNHFSSHLLYMGDMCTYELSRINLRNKPLSSIIDLCLSAAAHTVMKCSPYNLRCNVISLDCQSKCQP